MSLQPKLELSKRTDVELENYAQDKVNRIEKNADFPSAQNTVGLVKTKLKQYAAAVAILEGNKADTANKKQLRAELEKLVSLMATFCVIDSGDDAAKFLRSGFALKSSGSPVGTLPKPQQFTFALSNNSGEAFVSLEPYRKARGFSFAWTKEPLTPESAWQIEPSPTREYTFSGLPSGVKVWAKGGAISPDGTINYSDPVSRIIQ